MLKCSEMTLFKQPLHSRGLGEVTVKRDQTSCVNNLCCRTLGNRICLLVFQACLLQGMALIFEDSTFFFQSCDYLCRKQEDMEAHTVLPGGPVRDGWT